MTEVHTLLIVPNASPISRKTGANRQRRINKGRVIQDCTKVRSPKVEIRKKPEFAWSRWFW